MSPLTTSPKPKFKKWAEKAPQRGVLAVGARSTDEYVMVEMSSGALSIAVNENPEPTGRAVFVSVMTPPILATCPFTSRQVTRPTQLYGTGNAVGRRVSK